MSSTSLKSMLYFWEDAPKEWRKSSRQERIGICRQARVHWNFSKPSKRKPWVIKITSTLLQLFSMHWTIWWPANSNMERVFRITPADSRTSGMWWTLRWEVPWWLQSWWWLSQVTCQQIQPRWRMHKERLRKNFWLICTYTMLTIPSMVPSWPSWVPNTLWVMISTQRPWLRLLQYFPLMSLIPHTRPTLRSMIPTRVLLMGTHLRLKRQTRVKKWIYPLPRWKVNVTVVVRQATSHLNADTRTPNPRINGPSTRLRQLKVPALHNHLSPLHLHLLLHPLFNQATSHQLHSQWDGLEPTFNVSRIRTWESGYCLTTSLLLQSSATQGWWTTSEKDLKSWNCLPMEELLRQTWKLIFQTGVRFGTTLMPSLTFSVMLRWLTDTEWPMIPTTRMHSLSTCPTTSKSNLRGWHWWTSMSTSLSQIWSTVTLQLNSLPLWKKTRPSILRDSLKELRGPENCIMPLALLPSMTSRQSSGWMPSPITQWLQKTSKQLKRSLVQTLEASKARLLGEPLSLLLMIKLRFQENLSQLRRKWPCPWMVWRSMACTSWQPSPTISITGQLNGCPIKHLRHTMILCSKFSGSIPLLALRSLPFTVTMSSNLCWILWQLSSRFISTLPTPRNMSQLLRGTTELSRRESGHPITDYPINTYPGWWWNYWSQSLPRSWTSFLQSMESLLTTVQEWSCIRDTWTMPSIVNMLLALMFRHMKSPTLPTPMLPGVLIAFIWGTMITCKGDTSYFICPLTPWLPEDRSPQCPLPLPSSNKSMQLLLKSKCLKASNLPPKLDNSSMTLLGLQEWIMMKMHLKMSKMRTMPQKMKSQLRMKLKLMMR